MRRTRAPRSLRSGTLRGVWQWPADVPAETLEGVGAGLGWHTVVLDTAGVRSKEEFLQACSDAFALPSWFGMNWDALLDCLSALDVGESVGILIAWRGWQDLSDGAAEEFATAVEVLSDTAARWADDDVPGVILLVGEPAVAGLPSL